MLVFEQAALTRWQTLFSNGFRPLFLCVGISGIVLISLWILVFSGLWPMTSLAVPLLTWHGHEMLFGFVGAAMGGFLLAAVANWTNRLPISGGPLLLLTLCWLLGRVVMGCGAALPYGLVAVIDGSYSLLLMLLVGREVISAGNQRNYKVVVLLALFSALNLLFHLGIGLDMGWEALALRGAIMLICLLLALIGGRITPAFTRNYLLQQDRARGTTGALPQLFDQLDKVASILLGMAAVSWVGWPQQPVSVLLLTLAGLMQWLRLMRWQGWRIRHEALLWVLHSGFFWLGLGLLLLAGGSAGLWPDSVGIHALAIGAMAGMILGVASRAALGHTRRPLVAGRLMTLAFALMSLAALFRLSASWLAGEFYWPLLWAAAGTWSLALLLFCIRYVPILLRSAPGWQRPE